MDQRLLKKIRVAVSLVFFLLTFFLFVDFAALISLRMIRAILFLQFIPSLLEFIHLASLAAAGFIFILVLTALFGRVYCSSVCPLGTLQDFFIRVGGRFRNKKKNRFKKSQTLLRYTLLALVVVPLFFRSIAVAGLLDPYSLAGRIFSNLVRPVWYEGNNLAVKALKSADLFWLYPATLKSVALPSILFSAVFLFILILLNLRKGRWYCNAICPVGTALGIVSRFSLFRIKINRTACTSCGLCLRDCKSNCIDLKNHSIDFSRCVACYNCISACNDEAVGYARSVFQTEKTETPGPVILPAEPAPDSQRRDFLKTIAGGAVGTAALLTSTDVFAEEKKKKGVSKYPVTPPGSVSLLHFTEKCTACHLCVSVCPTKVLQPTLFEYGLSGLFLPKMNFWVNYCSHECVKCSQVCPSGAILPLTVREKSDLQIGYVWFSRHICIVKEKNTACGACSEHCPTKAVQMVPYENGLMIPVVDETICIGCGACEYACPTTPVKAIYVESNPYHKTAKKPPRIWEEEEGAIKQPTEDFPF